MTNRRKDRRVGTVLDGRFRLDEVLGAGGMGKVYAGVQLSVDRRVAVKVLREELSESETLAQRFFREAKVVASLRHSNIVGLVDFGRDDELGLLYIAMEYVDGVSLAELLRRGRMETALVVGIARQICSALAEAHASGVIHRDLKPDNVMLITTAEGALSVKVLDFGIALPTGDEARLTNTGAVVGTPHYMAPEQAQDRPITARSDIYSLGVLIYEMLTGRLPFVADTPMAVLLKVITQTPPALDEVLSPAHMPPPELAQLLTSMLSKDPAGRPADIATAAAAFDELTRAYQLVTPTVSTGSGFEALVVRHASDEFVNAPTAASPAPTPSAPSHVAPVSTADIFKDQAEPVAPPELNKPTPRRRWLWLLPVGFVACCCIPMLLLPGPPNDGVPVPTRADVGTDLGLGSDLLGNQGRTATDVGPRDLGVLEPVEALEPLQPPESIEPPPAHELMDAPTGRRPADRRPSTGAPSVVEADGTVRGGARGGTCSSGVCEYSDGPVGCSGRSKCWALCPSGGCAQTAYASSTAVFDCDGGGCQQACFGDANCVLECSGGGCKQQCVTNGECDKDCSGGECS